MNEEKIRAAIKVECDRQRVGEDRQVMLRKAFDEVSHWRGDTLGQDWLRGLAGMIEPDNKGQYRTTPVSFNGIVGGVVPGALHRSMLSWIDWFNFELGVSIDSIAAIETREVVIKEFLDIHPFIDGNGRTAWLLRVWMLNQWDDPQPLPNYFKSN